MIVKNMYKERILNVYPDSDFAKFIIDDLSLDAAHKPSENAIKGRKFMVYKLR